MLACWQTDAIMTPTPPFSPVSPLQLYLLLSAFYSLNRNKQKKVFFFFLFICSYCLSVARGSVSLSSGKQSQAVCYLLLTAHTLGVSPTQYIIENGCCGPFGTLLFFLHQQRRHCQEAALGGFAFFPPCHFSPPSLSLSPLMPFSLWQFTLQLRLLYISISAKMVF